MVNDPVKPLQPEKAPFPIDITELGMVNDPVKPLQPEKVPSGTDDQFGKATDFNPVQFEKT